MSEPLCWIVCLCGIGALLASLWVQRLSERNLAEAGRLIDRVLRERDA